MSHRLWHYHWFGEICPLLIETYKHGRSLVLGLVYFCSLSGMMPWLMPSKILGLTHYLFLYPTVLNSLAPSHTQCPMIHVQQYTLAMLPETWCLSHGSWWWKWERIPVTEFSRAEMKRYVRRTHLGRLYKMPKVGDVLLQASNHWQHL